MPCTTVDALRCRSDESILAIEPHLLPHGEVNVPAPRGDDATERAPTGGWAPARREICDALQARQKARVKPPLEPAKRELTTLLKMDPNE